MAESRIVGDQFSSPSAQGEIQPDGSAVVLSTHEQILGDDGQVYLGSLPSDEHAPQCGPGAVQRNHETLPVPASPTVGVGLDLATRRYRSDTISSWR